LLGSKRGHAAQIFIFKPKYSRVEFAIAAVVAVPRYEYGGDLGELVKGK